MAGKLGEREGQEKVETRAKDYLFRVLVDQGSTDRTVGVGG